MEGDGEEVRNRLYLNDGNGIFTAVDVSERSDESTGVVAGDFNGDGAIDLIIVNKDASANNPSREHLINDGSGSFTSVVGGDATIAHRPSIASNSDVNQVSACDIDLDGDLVSSLAKSFSALVLESH